MLRSRESDHLRAYSQHLLAHMSPSRQATLFTDFRRNAGVVMSRATVSADTC